MTYTTLYCSGFISHYFSIFTKHSKHIKLLVYPRKQPDPSSQCGFVHHCLLLQCLLREALVVL